MLGSDDHLHKLKSRRTKKSTLRSSIRFPVSLNVISELISFNSTRDVSWGICLVWRSLRRIAVAEKSESIGLTEMITHPGISGEISWIITSRYLELQDDWEAVEAGQPEDMGTHCFISILISLKYASPIPPSILVTVSMMTMVLEILSQNSVISSLSLSLVC